MLFFRLFRHLQIGHLGSQHYAFDTTLGEPFHYIQERPISAALHRTIGKLIDAGLREQPMSEEALGKVAESAREQKHLQDLIEQGYLFPVEPPQEAETAPSQGEAQGTSQTSGGDIGSALLEVQRPLFIEDSRRFFCLPEDISDENAAVGFVGVPVSTAQRTAGTRLGPSALRILSGVMPWWKLFKRGVYADAWANGAAVMAGKGLVAKDYGDFESRTIGALFDDVMELVGRLHKNEVGGIFVGGDHGISIPLIHAYATHHKDLCVVHLDAHHDLYMAEFPRFCNADPILSAHRHSKISQSWSFGVRSLPSNPTHFERLNSVLEGRAKHYSVSATRSFLQNPATLRRLLGPQKKPKAYLTIDLDVLTESEVDGRITTPMRSGLTWDELFAFVVAASSCVDFVGADVVEFNPLRSRGTTGVDRPVDETVSLLVLLALVLAKDPALATMPSCL